ncbi:MAG TPA: hypothetical protein DEB17_00455 [Chlorobaculum sp.]|uniref:Uncharacterized protein n=1 Tax=Chlorobaculum tepidum (strain ATCC 49652 / DSM 12025 / NBRC 103806 / TLS) TaxID=194439 RepID=Q8KC13_CHLTE|nr:hypothetical protein CT1617 [Chlorobaculum tepidum TLS]HBU22470.1 hypothetical protein [Chlorobaculum sp.]
MQNGSNSIHFDTVVMRPSCRKKVSAKALGFRYWSQTQQPAGKRRQ